MEAKDFDKKTPISEYNEAQNQITRLNNLWLDCQRYSRSGQYNDWNFTLDCVWRELYADAMKRNDKKYSKMWFLMNKLVYLTKSKKQLYYSLQNKEQFLRKLQDDVGKGSKRTDTYEDLMS